MSADWQKHIRLLRVLSRDEIVDARIFPAADHRAVDRVRAVSAARVSGEGEARCFFHDTNRAETTCESCGRFVCGLCTIAIGSVKLCPTCLVEGRKSGRTASLQQHGAVWDNRLLLLAVLPFIPPAIVGLAFSSVLTLILVAGRWSKPPSLIRPSRERYVLAAAVALIGLPLGLYIINKLFLTP